MACALRLYELRARRPPIVFCTCTMCLQKRMWKRAIKAFQNLQLTEHHIDSLQQSAAGASGDERWRGRRKRRGAAQLAGCRGLALLRHRPPDIPGPDYWPDSLLVPVRVPQLPEARVWRAVVDVQRPVLRRGGGDRCWHGGVLPCACRGSTTFLS